MHTAATNTLLETFRFTPLKFTPDTIDQLEKSVYLRIAFKCQDVYQLFQLEWSCPVSDA